MVFVNNLCFAKCVFLPILGKIWLMFNFKKNVKIGIQHIKKSNKHHFEGLF